MRRTVAFFTLLSLSGCVMTPKEPNYTVEVSGDYRVVADCAFLTFQDRGLYFARADLVSRRTVRLNLAVDGVVLSGVQAGYIDFTESAPGRTRATASIAAGLPGKAGLERNYGTVIRQCAG